jgi:hypothetical protein
MPARLRFYDPNGPPRPDLGRVCSSDGVYVLNADGEWESKDDPDGAAEVNEIYGGEPIDVTDPDQVFRKLREHCIAILGMSFEVTSTGQKFAGPSWDGIHIANRE